jgi:hypothetical protein
MSKNASTTRTHSFNLAGISVTFAMPVSGDIPPETVISILETFRELGINTIPYQLDFEIGGTLCEARNKAVVKFLEGPSNRLFFVDKDIVWKASDVLRLLALSTIFSIVVGVYPTRSEPLTFYIGLPPGVTKIPPGNEYGLVPITGTGLGFTCLRREVVQTLSDKAPPIQYMRGCPVPEVFTFTRLADGHWRGEDIAFFDDAKKAGHQTWWDPEIQLGHIGRYEWRATPDQIREANERAA